MAISINDLPQRYQAQALTQVVQQERRRGTSGLPPDTPAEKPPKYRNEKTTRVTATGAVLRFDSQKEARRYDELALLEQAGRIRDLRLQADFTLQEAYTDTDGNRVRAIRYKADFTYCTAGGALVVEDVKSVPTRTREYIMKKKMLKDRRGIDISEV